MKFKENIENESEKEENKMKKLRLIGLIVLGIVVVLALVAYIALPGILANIMLFPGGQALVKNPGDYGLTYKDVTLMTEDGVELAAWFMKSTGNDAIIIGHPATFTRYGYNLDSEHPFGRTGYDREVEFIPTAKHLVEAGYSVLMVDQRNHGESGASPDNGPHNPVAAWPDLLAAVEFVKDQPDLKDGDIGLLSFCQSAIVSMVAQAEAPEALKEAGVKAFVAVQPIDIEIFYRNFGLPGWVVNRMKANYRKKGLDMTDQNPLLYAPNIFLPTLFVQNVNDPWSDMDHSRAIYDAIPTEKKAIWIDEEAHHRFLTYNWFNDNPKKLLDFLDQHLDKIE